MLFRRIVVGFVLLFPVGSTVGVLCGVEKAEEAKPSLMKRKLQHSQKILEGITQKDFRSIEKNAGELIDISRHAEWREYKTPLYERLSDQFRRESSQMMTNAKEKNLDGVMLNYFALTRTCVRCHDHMRKAKMTHHREKTLVVVGQSRAIQPGYVYHVLNRGNARSAASHVGRRPRPVAAECRPSPAEGRLGRVGESASESGRGRRPSDYIWVKRSDH